MVASSGDGHGGMPELKWPAARCVEVPQQECMRVCVVVVCVKARCARVEFSAREAYAVIASRSPQREVQ